MFGGGGGGGDTETTVRYAEYIEEYHKFYLDRISNTVLSLLGSTPKTYSSEVDLEVGLLGASNLITDFPSVFETFEDFMYNLNIDTTYDNILADCVEHTVINSRVSAHATELQNEIDQTSWPQIATGMRDINAVMTSSFVISKTMLQSKKAEILSRYDAEIRIQMIPQALQRWTQTLQWKEGVTRMNAENHKFYILSLIDQENHNSDLNLKEILWPFTLYEYYRVALGTLTGAKRTSTMAEGATVSRGATATGGALSGAAAGAYVGSEIYPGWGTAIGAVVGGIAGAIGGYNQ